MPALAPSVRPPAVYVRPPESLWIACALVALAVLAGPHPVVGLAALIAVPLLLTLSWRSYEPPVITFIAGYHWVQATMILWLSIALGTDIDEFARFPGAQMLNATILSLVGVVVMLLGVRTAWSSWRSRQPFAPDKISGMQPYRVLLLYAILAAFGAAADAMRLAAPAAWQIIAAVKQARFAFLFLICIYCFQQRRHWLLLGAALAFDVLTGFFSYFAEFKTAIFVAALALLTTGLGGLTQRQKVSIGAISLLLFAFAAMWTSIKTEYRMFLNQGSGVQETSVSYAEQAAKLRDLLWDGEINLADGMRSALERIGYVEFFGHVLNQVPQNVPYEDGRLLLDAIGHLAVPRVLYPDKPALVSDTVITQHYTGLFLGGDSGTSISMGYMADAYIDFGPIGMFLAIFAWGALLGVVYYWFNRAGDPLSAATGVAVLLSAALLETTAVKQLGGLLSGMLVMAGALFLVGNPLRHWLFPPARR